MIPKPLHYDFVYFDWDRTKVTYFRNDEPMSHEIPTLRMLIEQLDRPTVLIGESTFESYNLNERKAVYDLAISRGHKWYGTPNRLTYRWRNRFGWDKTDSNDARTIRIIAEYPFPLHTLRGYKQEGELQTVDGMKSFVYDPISMLKVDVSPYIGNGIWTRLRKIEVDDPETFRENEFDRREAFRLKQMEAMDFRRLDDKVKAQRYLSFKRQVLATMNVEPGTTITATNKNFTEQFPLLNNSVMWAVAFAANSAKDRNEFEALLGASAHGAKSMLRSQLYHWGWAGNGKGPMNKGESLRDYRKQVRKLGAIVHKNGLTV